MRREFGEVFFSREVARRMIEEAINGKPKTNHQTSLQRAQLLTSFKNFNLKEENIMCTEYGDVFFSRETARKMIEETIYGKPKTDY